MDRSGHRPPHHDAGLGREVSGIEDKIAALLAKAESTNFPEEAEAFMAKAEELMLKHGIERAMLEGRRPGVSAQPIVVEKIFIRNSAGYAVTLIDLAFAIAPSFNCRALQNLLPGRDRVAWFIGHQDDVAQAVQLFNSLVVQAPAQARHWWRTEGRHSPWADTSSNGGYLARREFIAAFASGVRQRLEETRSRVVDETGPGTALVLVDRAKKVDSWVDENLQVRRSRSQGRNSGGMEARVAGRQAGREAIQTKAVR